MKAEIERRWQAHGLDCAVALVPAMGHRCGYVRLPENHVWHGYHHMDIESIAVHGGVTFSGPHKQLGPGWWIGFDCAHYGDYVPGMATMTGGERAELDERTRPFRELLEALFPIPPWVEVVEPIEAHWQEDEVAEEVERLAAQVAEVAGLI